jgi:hypothetical protein
MTSCGIVLIRETLIVRDPPYILCMIVLGCTMDLH